MSYMQSVTSFASKWKRAKLPILLFVNI